MAQVSLTLGGNRYVGDSECLLCIRKLSVGCYDADSLQLTRGVRPKIAIKLVVDVMLSTPDNENALVSPWVAHALALVTVLTLLCALYVNLFVLDDGEIYRANPIVGVPVALAIFWLMGWMAADVIGGRRTSNRGYWLVSMVLIPVFSTLAYYFFLWRPAKSGSSQ